MGRPPDAHSLGALQVQFLGAVTKQQPYMIVAEYLSGGSLADYFKASHFPTLKRAVGLALDTAKGMNYLHNRSPQVGAGPPLLSARPGCTEMWPPSSALRHHIEVDVTQPGKATLGSYCCRRLPGAVLSYLAE